MLFTCMPGLFERSLYVVCFTFGFRIAWFGELYKERRFAWSGEFIEGDSLMSVEFFLEICAVLIYLVTYGDAKLLFVLCNLAGILRLPLLLILTLALL